MIFYVWFPLMPNASISASERMGLLTGIRKESVAIPFWTDKYANVSSSYSDKFSSRGTSYSDKHSSRGTSYSDKYSARNL